MNSFDLWGVGAGVVKEDYQRVIVNSGFLERSRLRNEWWGEPYLYAFQQCITEAAREADEQLPRGQRITFIFDQQATFAARATSVYEQMENNRPWTRRERLGGIFFRSKRDSIALQAADILVYELRKRLDHRLHEPEREIRISVNRLRNRVGSSRFATARELQLFVEQFSEAGRSD
jgi:hypothetical protein